MPKLAHHAGNHVCAAAAKRKGTAVEIEKGGIHIDPTWASGMRGSCAAAAPKKSFWDRIRGR